MQMFLYSFEMKYLIEKFINSMRSRHSSLHQFSIIFSCKLWPKKMWEKITSDASLYVKVHRTQYKAYSERIFLIINTHEHALHFITIINIIARQNFYRRKKSFKYLQH